METETYKISPIRLREARGDKKGSAVARQLGISRQRLYAYETGKDRPPGEIALRLCLLYGVEPDYFLEKSSREA